jgi:glycyl-tRNA synthetase (class II)
LKSPRGKAIAKLLNHVQNPTVCSDKDFMTNRGENGRKLKRSVPIQQEIRDLHRDEWEKLPEELQTYFSMIEKTRKWGGPIKMFQFKYSWMYETQIKPHYITHAYVLHNEVISEYEYVWDKLYNSDMLAYKYLTGRSYRDDYDWNKSKKRSLEKITTKEAKEEINNFNRGKRKYLDDWDNDFGYW